MPSMTSKTTVHQAATTLFTGTRPQDRAVQGIVAASMMGAGYAGSAHLYSAGTAVAIIRRIQTLGSIHRKTIGPITGLMSTIHSIESIYKIRKGGYRPAFTVKYEPYDPWWVPPNPFGPMPIIRRRLEIGARPVEQSRGGEHTSRSGTPSAGLSTPGPSAQNKSRASRKKPRGMISRANRRGAPTSGRRRPRPPYCATHKRRHWCRITRKR